MADFAGQCGKEHMRSMNEFRALRFKAKKLAARNAYLENQIMDLMQRQAEIAYQAHHDSLTGLLTRDIFIDRFNQAKCLANRHHHSLALLFLDLDKFKLVNDSLGHAVGDDLLKVVAQRLNNVLRATDAACRYGGDEFLILLSEIRKRSDVNRVLGDVCRIIDGKYSIDFHEVHITASVGAALYPADGQTYDELFQFADQTMYRNKYSDRSGVRRDSRLKVI